MESCVFLRLIEYQLLDLRDDLLVAGIEKISRQIDQNQRGLAIGAQNQSPEIRVTERPNRRDQRSRSGTDSERLVLRCGIFVIWNTTIRASRQSARILCDFQQSLTEFKLTRRVAFIDAIVHPFLVLFGQTAIGATHNNDDSTGNECLGKGFAKQRLAHQARTARGQERELFRLHDIPQRRGHHGSYHQHANPSEKQPGPQPVNQIAEFQKHRNQGLTSGGNEPPESWRSPLAEWRMQNESSAYARISMGVSVGVVSLRHMTVTIMLMTVIAMATVMVILFWSIFLEVCQRSASP